MKTRKERFEEKYTKGDGCWEWQAYKDRQGYGRFSIRRVARLAHRISYELYVGKIPDGLCCLHRCDNPACVRPDHLFLGTQDENVYDRDVKGRGPIGEKHGSAKLTEEQVMDIRAMYGKGKTTQTKIAEMFGVDQHTISSIVLLKTWAHLR